MSKGVKIDTVYSYTKLSKYNETFIILNNLYA